MDLFKIAASLTLDTSKYTEAVDKAKKSGTELVKNFTSIFKNAKTTKNEIKVLSSEYKDSKKKVQELTTAFNESVKSTGKTSEKSRELAKQLKEAREKTASLKTELNGLKGKLDEAGNSSKSFGDKLKSIGSVAVKGFGAITAASAAVGGALLAVAENTEEYRIAQGKLNTAYEAAGYGTDTAKTAYTEFYKILGDTDTATEASQLLAKLAESQEDVTKWTNIAAGVSGTFGDSLPIEGLIESANETAKVGQVTGTLADALNWAGISEDEFNEKLANCSSESERNQLIMNTLSGTYDEASESFYKNNEELVKQRENQAKLDETMAKLGTTVTNIKNKLLGEFLPGITSVAEAFNGMLNGEEGAEKQFSNAISNMINNVSKKLPQFLEFGGKILKSIISGITESAPQLLSSALEIILTLGKGLAEYTPELITTITDLIIDLALMLTDPDTLIEIVNAALQIIIALANGIAQALPKLLEQAPVIISNLVTAIITAVPMLLKAAGEVITTLITGISNGFSKLKESGQEVINKVKDGISQKIEEAKTWGKDLIDNFIGGIKQKWNDLKQTVSDTAQKVKDFLGFSEPKEGPLSNFHTYAPDMMDLFIKGIKDNEDKLQAQIGKSFNFQSTITANPITGTSGINNSRQIVVNNTFNGDYTERDSAKIVRSINRKLGLQMV